MRRNQRWKDRQIEFQNRRFAFLWIGVIVLVTLTVNGCRNRDQGAPSLFGKASGPTRVIPPATGAAVSPQTATGSSGVSTNTSTYPAANAWNYSVQSSAAPANSASSANSVSAAPSTSSSTVPPSPSGTVPATSEIPVVPAPPLVDSASASGGQPLTPQQVGGIAPPRRFTSTETTDTSPNLVWRNPTTGVVPTSATLTAPANSIPANSAGTTIPGTTIPGTTIPGTTSTGTNVGLTPVRTVTSTNPATASGQVLPVVYYPATTTSVTAIPTTNATPSVTVGPKANPVRNATNVTRASTTASVIPTTVSTIPNTTSPLQLVTPTSAPVLQNVPTSTVEEPTRWQTGPAPRTTETAATILPSGVVLPRPIDVTTSR